VAQAEGLVMPTNKNMKTTYQDKQTWHGIFSLKFARGGPTWCILFGIMRESCVEFLPKLFRRLKHVGKSWGVAGKSWGAWMMLSQAIWTSVFHRSFD